MKLKLIYLTDSHYRGTNPKARLDDYPQSIATKLREVYGLARDLTEFENSDYTRECEDVLIVHGGDLFDRPDTAYMVAGKMAALLAESPCEVLVVPGNHEIYAYNLDSLPRTALGLLAQVGLITILDRKPFQFGAPKFKVDITGQGYYHDIDRNPQDYMVEREADPKRVNYHVHVVHGMLVERPLPYEVAHTTIKDCKTNADVILSGHEHLGYGLKRRDDGVWFCNPGALGRVSAKVEEMHRPIRVAVFTFTEDGISAELVPLKSARPGHEVLSRDHLIQAAEREERTAQFLALLAEDRETRLLDTREIINHIADSDQLPEPVRVEALNRLGRAREQLKTAAGTFFEGI